jgi:putative FmdB family regulatory protein
MPIYEYACKSCGHQVEALQKINDDPLTDCPECGDIGLEKQVSAAGFVLKGGGWYVTDFREKGKKKDPGGEAGGQEKKQETKKEDGGPATPAACGSGNCAD